MRYRVEVTREDGWWMIAIPEIDGLTQARGEDELVTHQPVCRQDPRQLAAVAGDQP